MGTKSTRPASVGKPKKPRADFPLFPHATGRWAKKVRGHLVYFGKVSADPRGEKALEIWLEERDEILHTGQRAARRKDVATVDDAVNGFLEAKDLAVKTGEISPRQFQELRSAAARSIKVLGRYRPLSTLTPDDFRRLKQEIARTRKTLTTLANEITRTKAPFLWAFANDLIEAPVRFGTDFARPPKGKLRAERNKQRGEDWTFAPFEVLALQDAAGVHLRAMLFLAINAGFGPTDLAQLPAKAVDLTRGWINFPRPKTGVKRRVPLWPETIAALEASAAARPANKDDDTEEVFFRTRFGQRWADSRNHSAISSEFAKLAKRVGVHRDGRGIYGLRHTFRTIASRSRDIEAVRAIMGHTHDHVEEVYLHGIEDERLMTVVECVRAWLFADRKDGAR